MRAALGGGLLLVAVGAALLGQQVGAWDLPAFVDAWWPSSFVLAGVVAAVAGKRWAPLLLVVLGVLLFVVRFGRFDAPWWDRVWPVLLLATGVWLVAWAVLHRADADPTVRAVGAFGGQSKTAEGRFSGGEVIALLGGAELDLRQAFLPAEGATVTATAVFGGAEIRVPAAWRVEVRARNWGGTVEQKGAPGKDGALLVVDATVVLGGLEIVHET